MILAVPPERLARLIPDGAGVSAGMLRQLGTSPIVNLHVIFDRKVTDLSFAAGVGTPVQWLFDRTGSGGLDARASIWRSLLSAADE